MLLEQGAGLLICLAAFIFLFLFVLITILHSVRRRPRLDHAAINLCAFRSRQLPYQLLVRGAPLEEESVW